MTCACIALDTVTRVRKPLSAKPMLPNVRPSSPLRSRNPRCNRAGTVTVMLSDILLTHVSRAPRRTGLFDLREKTTLDLELLGNRREIAPRARARERVRIMTEQAIKERTYSEDEIKARLAKELPHWWFEGGWIRRKYKTNSWKGTLMVINAVGHLAEVAWHHPDITASYAWVEVRLMNHAAKGITDKDFALAKKIEEVVHWQPGEEEGALEGTPAEDMRFAYIKYDKPKA